MHAPVSVPHTRVQAQQMRVSAMHAPVSVSYARVRVQRMRVQSGLAAVLAQEIALSGPSDGLYPLGVPLSRRSPRPCRKRMLPSP
jgi:hypothetical protein